MKMKQQVRRHRKSRVIKTKLRKNGSNIYKYIGGWGPFFDVGHETYDIIKKFLEKHENSPNNAYNAYKQWYDNLSPERKGKSFDPYKIKTFADISRVLDIFQKIQNNKVTNINNPAEYVRLSTSIEDIGRDEKIRERDEARFSLAGIRY
jgi:hypothetical protein